MPTLLELKHISKHCGAIQVLSDVDLTLEPGEVLSLMGDNGAVKSTLVKIIVGNFLASDGEIRLEILHCGARCGGDARAPQTSSLRVNAT